jgi:hypothetical protein
MIKAGAIDVAGEKGSEGVDEGRLPLRLKGAGALGLALSPALAGAGPHVIGCRIEGRRGQCMVPARSFTTATAPAL